jgi:DNA-directed RNA polymerase subunit RPC12/RpoP
MNQKQVIMLEEEQDALNCEYCSQKKAEIFQVTGYYCLQCWQEETHPNV